VLLLAACNDDSNSPNSSPSQSSAGAEQACIDMADAVADAAERACSQDYQANYEAFEQSAAGGSCRNVKMVRDENSLRSVCIPWFATATCVQLSNTSSLPSECKSQLLR
jgi:hypothetical protein